MGGGADNSLQYEKVSSKMLGGLKESWTDFSQPSWHQNCVYVEKLSSNSFKMKAKSTGAKVVFDLGNMIGKTISFQVKGQEKGTGNFLWFDGSNWYGESFEISDSIQDVIIDLKKDEIQAISFEPTDIEGKIEEEDYLIKNIQLDYYDLQEYKDLITKGYKARVEETLNIIEWDQNSIKGDIGITGNKMLFLSIPDAIGWNVKVDGSLVKPERITFGFMGIPLTEGIHEIYLSYCMPGLREGMFATILAAIILIFIKKRKISM